MGELEQYLVPVWIVVARSISAHGCGKRNLYRDGRPRNGRLLLADAGAA